MAFSSSVDTIGTPKVAVTAVISVPGRACRAASARTRSVTAWVMLPLTNSSFIGRLPTGPPQTVSHRRGDWACGTARSKRHIADAADDQAAVDPDDRAGHVGSVGGGQEGGDGCYFGGVAESA